MNYNSLKNYNDILGQRVFVYFNLHKRCFSLKALEGSMKNRVICHASEVLLKDATFKVSEAGRQRVLLERRKNVHAGVVGTVLGLDSLDGLGGHKKATYNPYKNPYFYFKDNLESPLYETNLVYLKNKEIFVIK